MSQVASLGDELPAGAVQFETIVIDPMRTLDGKTRTVYISPLLNEVFESLDVGLERLFSDLIEIYLGYSARNMKLTFASDIKTIQELVDNVLTHMITLRQVQLFALQQQA
ncbi:hypothetical protein EUX98_g8116 [Antrodiella citrinella]|uniref:Uncharacterized protein n=1 Tax=Antrodiella citrinella TaxID=2447956 RepID=A0A4S4MC52_9APHY|nr:hypothetical protein EUX98_g8116 [Antrodiella citrinella]